MHRRIFLYILFFSLTNLVIHADTDYYSIVDISKECRCELRYDVWKGLYEISKGSSSVRLHEDVDWYIVNMNEIRFGLKSIKKESGEFFVDEKTANEIKNIFKKIESINGGIKYIVLDPGHGGKDPGAIGYYNSGGIKKTLKEKDVVLKTAIETAALLRARYPDKEILLTRSDDRYLKLEERTEIANSVELEEDKTMIFISIHANASFNTKASGFEVWYLPQEYRRNLIDKNKMKTVDSDVLPILNTMLEEEYSIESILLSDSLLKSIDQQIGYLSRNRGSKEESWFVVRNAHMPSVLIEVGFVTNQQEALNLSSDSYLKKLVRGIYNGIVDFVADYEKARGGS